MKDETRNKEKDEKNEETKKESNGKMKEEWKRRKIESCAQMGRNTRVRPGRMRRRRPRSKVKGRGNFGKLTKMKGKRPNCPWAQLLKTPIKAQAQIKAQLHKPNPNWAPDISKAQSLFAPATSKLQINS